MADKPDWKSLLNGSFLPNVGMDILRRLNPLSVANLDQVLTKFKPDLINFKEFKTLNLNIMKMKSLNKSKISEMPSRMVLKSAVSSIPLTQTISESGVMFQGETCCLHNHKTKQVHVYHKNIYQFTVDHTEGKEFSLALGGLVLVRTVCLNNGRIPSTIIIDITRRRQVSVISHPLRTK